MSKFRGIKGVKDILPEHLPPWTVVENMARRLAKIYGFHEIRIPIFEQTELFVRSIGGTTDVVEKEMYTFPDRDGTSLTLRPEGTASVVRAFIEHHLTENPRSHKLYYIGPMFRHERPQAGRFRQFHQFGVECIGTSHPLADVETITLLWNFFINLHLPGLTLEINSLGTLRERQIFKSELLNFLKSHKNHLCDNCQRRMETNPLRVLDCKVPSCRTVVEQAPRLSDFLLPESKAHFEEVLKGLKVLNIPYTVNPHLVRGLDYYSMTTFEVTCSVLGAQNAIGAGGRYDGLFETLGGAPTPAIGFAVGLERVILALPDFLIPPPSSSIFVAAFGEKGTQAGIQVLQNLRAEGIQAETDYRANSLKTLLRAANKLGSSFTLILGDDEADQNHIILRDMNAKSQEIHPLSSIIETVKTLIFPVYP